MKGKVDRGAFFIILDIKIIYRTVELILFKKKQYQDFKKFYE